MESGVGRRTRVRPPRDPTRVESLETLHQGPGEEEESPKENPKSYEPME